MADLILEGTVDTTEPPRLLRLACWMLRQLPPAVQPVPVRDYLAAKMLHHFESTLTVSFPALGIHGRHVLKPGDLQIEWE